jgi:hypothetical protein
LGDGCGSITDQLKNIGGDIDDLCVKIGEPGPESITSILLKLCVKIDEIPDNIIPPDLNPICLKIYEVNSNLEQYFCQIESDNADIYEKTCSVEDAVRKGCFTTIEKACDIEDEIGNGRGKTVQ